MGVREYWDRMLVYFGIVEDDEGDEPFEPRDHDGPRRRSSGEGRRMRTDVPRSRSDYGSRRSAGPAPQVSSGSRPRRERFDPASRGAGGVGIIAPRSFNDAQSIADLFKDGRPVIVNLQVSESELAKRIIDFASGLTYGLDGGMQRIAEKVFLLTPSDVEVSAEERAAMVESGFFNQS